MDERGRRWTTLGRLMGLAQMLASMDAAIADNRRAGLQSTGHDQELDRGHSKEHATRVISLRTFTLRAA